MPRTATDHALLAAVGARIAEIRRARGLTQATVAVMAGLDPQSFQRAESGRSSLSIPRMARIASALGVSLTDLFASGAAPVPASPWEPSEQAAGAAWRRIPAERRDLALRLLDDLAR